MIRYNATMRKDYQLDERQLRSILRCGRALCMELRDEITDEVDATLLAEGIAHELGCSEWLDDPTHPLWDVAADLSGA